MSPLSYFMIYPAILKLSLKATEKLLLCLILTFSERGLGMSNADIGKALNVSKYTVANTLSSLRKKGLIQTEKAGSKYRRIRPNMENLLHLLRSEVEEVYLTDLVSLPHSSSSKLPHSLGSEQKEAREEEDTTARNTSFAFVLKSGKQWHLPQPKVDEYKGTFPRLDIESELRKAAQWLIDHPHRRKTPTGMLTYIGGWLGRAKPGNDGNGLTIVPEATEEQIEAALQEVLA